MKKRLMAGFGAAALLVAATTGVASAAPPETTDGFVCPVLGVDGEVGGALTAPNGDHGITYIDQTGFDADPFFTVIGPTVTVPTIATNSDGTEGPHGDYASPGDTDYSAIWG